MKKSLSTDLVPITSTQSARTALDAAPRIRNPFDAWADTWGTNAQIAALNNANRLAQVTAYAADAEVKALDALMRRDGRLVEVKARQLLEFEILHHALEGERDKLREAEHQRNLAEERRWKERLEAQRETVLARHSIEAAEKFKETKFELGERRARARMADVDVDTTTSRAAMRELNKDISKRTAPDNPKAIITLLNTLRQHVVEGEADGVDTTHKRELVRMLEGIIAQW